MDTTDQTAPVGIDRLALEPTAGDAVGVHLPVGFRATSDREGFRLVMKQRPMWAKFMAPFALFWNGFMVVWFSIALTQGEWLMALFGTLHATAGLGMAYAALRGLFNRIELSVSRGTLTVRHRPFPWLRPPALSRGDLDQLFITEDDSLKVNNRPVIRYALKVRTRDRSEHTLCLVNEHEQARYLEDEIERAFHIEDRRVAGEHPKE